MTRYTKYKKTFNRESIFSGKPENDDGNGLSANEKALVEESKNQTVDELRLSTNQRSKPVCLRCRKRGHTVKFCPKGVENTCYNCGSRDHTLKACRKPRQGNLKFAACFICKQEGHISSQCPQNPNGIYPKGGGCRFCGSNKHLARDCRPTKEAEKGAYISASVDPKKENPDDDLVFESLSNIQGDRDAKRKARESGEAPTKNSASKAKKSKVVKF